MHEVLSMPVYVLLFFTLYFEVFLIYTFFEHKEEFKQKKLSPRRPGQYPTVTIIVPAWNEENTLAGTVNSLLALDYPKQRLSIFIIDDGSTDDTLAVARSFESNPQVKVFSKPNGGKHTAMNLGLAYSSSDLIGCLDADSFVASDAMKEIIPYFDDKEVMAVTASVEIHKPETLLQKVQSTEYMVGVFTRKVFSRFNGLYVTPGPFSIFRRSIFDTIGGFVHGYGTEDMEMAMRMQHHRMRIENAHTAHVYTVSPRTPSALYKQRVRWVSGFLKNAFFSYRHMFFNPKYGNLGMLTMPFAFISIFIALFFSSQYVLTLWKVIYEKLLLWEAVGIKFQFGMPHFDWFSLNLEFKRLLIYGLLLITVFFILYGAKLVMRRLHFSRNMLYFLLLYGLIAPFWLAKSLYNLITAKDATWR